MSEDGNKRKYMLEIDERLMDGGDNGDSGNGDLSYLDDDNGDQDMKRMKKNDDIDVRFLISSKEAGAIIGKGGANINRLRENYKSVVTVPDCPGPERVLSIVTSLDCLESILHDIISYVDDKPRTEEHEVELRLLIHTSHAGGIIGRGGQRIRELREQTKAAIKVFTQCAPFSSERVCAIQGAPQIVIEAIKIILDIILSTPAKGVCKLYDPFNFDIFAASEYGGFTEPGPRGAYRNAARGPTGASRRNELDMRPPWERAEPQMPIPPPQRAPPPHPDPWARMPPVPFDAPIGTERRVPPPPAPQAPANAQSWPPPNDNSHYGNPALHSLMVDSTPYWSDIVPPDNNANTMPMSFAPITREWNTVYENTSNVSPERHLPLDIIENADGSVSASLTVANSVAGAIIGKGGNRIRLVRRDSGADISIDNANGPNKDRVICIKGTQEQVRCAYNLLQRSIAENTRTRY